MPTLSNSGLMLSINRPTVRTTQHGPGVWQANEQKDVGNKNFYMHE